MYIDLECCPDCGGSADIKFRTKRKSMRTYKEEVFIECDNCGKRGIVSAYKIRINNGIKGFDLEAKAINKAVRNWNEKR